MKLQPLVRSSRPSWARMAGAVLLAVACAVVAGQITGRAQSTSGDALKFFKNYFVTGDYAVGGVGMKGRGVNGIATGVIHIPQTTGNTVPQNADVLSAFLYWQVVSTSTLGADASSAGARFNGYSLTTTDSSGATLSFGKVLDTAGTPPCWSSGGSTGNSGGNKLTYSYRADVLRFLDVDQDPASPGYGKYIVHKDYQVQLPDSGSGNGIPIALGASLVVIYRTEDPSTPLSAIAMYDGGYTLNNAVPTMSQTVRGFYQAGATPNAKLTHIVGSAQLNKTETLSITSSSGTTLFQAVNPFTGDDGGATGGAWDTRTFSFALPPGASSVATQVNQSTDCLTWGAVIVKTEVQDQDGDGLLDVWEEPWKVDPATSKPVPIVDPNGQPLPNLYAMGAREDHKDIFMELGWMKTAVETPYGSVVKPKHDHMPSPAAIRLVGDAFKNAPVANPDGTTGIRLHIDAGASYPAGEADDYIIRGQDSDGNNYARGGEVVTEAPVVNGVPTPCSRLSTDPPWACQFGNQQLRKADGTVVSTTGYPGTVGWKTGFRFLRDAWENPDGTEMTAAQQTTCDTSGSCRARFDRNRKDVFHYALFAHFVGLPKSAQPCLDSTGQPTREDPATGRCTVADNPDFHVPATNTGIGDYRGGDILMTLGAFSDIYGDFVGQVGGTGGTWTPFPTGTTTNVAGTLLHEFGHNAWRRHGGDEFEPNCKPTYLSVMNYLYQLRGLSKDDGTSVIDLSGTKYSPALNEQSLNDGAFTTSPGALPYRIGWYAPLVGSYLEPRGIGVAAKRHCDGSDLNIDPTTKLPTEPKMVRIDARYADLLAHPIDWLGNGTATSGITLDINFNGRTTATLGGTAAEMLGGSDDWSNIRLNQIGSRRNVGGLFVLPSGDPDCLSVNTPCFVMGPMSLDVGRGDTGRGDTGRGDTGSGDAGRGDTGRGDTGRGDTGRGDTGRGDTGRGDTGRGDTGRGDTGGGDLFLNNPNNPGGELDFETAADLAKTPPSAFTACVIGSDAGCLPSTPSHRVSLAWAAPNVANVQQYIVYRLAGADLVPGVPWTEVGRLPSVQLQPGQQAQPYSLIDTADLVNGAHYTYFAVAVYPTEANSANPIQSDPSNVVTITAVNSPFGAGADAYTTLEDTPLVVAAPGVLANDGDPDSSPTLAAALVSSTAHGTLSFNANGSFTYTPAANYNGSDSFTYTVTATYPGGATVQASQTVTLTVTSVNDPPVAGNDSYSVLQGSVLTVPAPGVLSNDSDVDSPSVTAVLVSGPTHGTLGALGLNANGSFTYTPAASYNGLDAFTYRATDGLNAGNIATVTITVSPTYTLVGLQNVPPATITKTKAGSSVPMKWQFKNGSAVVNSGAVRQTVTVVGAVNVQYNTDSGSSFFRYDPTSNTWSFNLQTKDANGVPYPIGNYTVTITPSTPGYLPSPPFTLTLTK